MFEIDRNLAERTLKAMPLTDGAGRFAQWWLSRIDADGRPLPSVQAAKIPGDLAASTLVCEVRPWSTVLCHSAGDNITRVLGVNLAGRDLLALLPPAGRAIRLSRFVKVAGGGVQLSYRGLVLADGNSHRVQELMFPHPDRELAPIEPAAAMVIAYIDSHALVAGRRVLISQGALDIADEPVFVDLRLPSALAACG